MTSRLCTIAWRRRDEAAQLLVAGDDWLSAGLLATLPSATRFESLPDDPQTIIAARGALSTIADTTLAGARDLLLIDPEAREAWRAQAKLAGRPKARIVALPSLSAIGAAEHALLLILSLSRRLLPAYSALVAGDLRQAERSVQGDRAGQNWAGLPEPSTLAGQTLGIVGLGRSGTALASRALALGMTVIYHDIADRSDVEARLNVRRRRFDQLLREADVASLHLPVTAQTNRIIDAPELAAMKPTALLINIADGRLVDEGALSKTLRGGDIAGAGLDAFAYEPLSPDSPLIGYENVVLTPATAWISAETEQQLWLRQLVERLSGER